MIISRKRMIADYYKISRCYFFLPDNRLLPLISTRCLTYTGVYILFKDHSLKDNKTFPVLYFICEDFSEMINQYSVVMKIAVTAWSLRLCQSVVFMKNNLQLTQRTKRFSRKSLLMILNMRTCIYSLGSWNFDQFCSEHTVYMFTMSRL